MSPFQLAIFCRIFLRPEVSLKWLVPEGNSFKPIRLIVIRQLIPSLGYVPNLATAKKNGKALLNIIYYDIYYIIAYHMRVSLAEL